MANNLRPTQQELTKLIDGKEQFMRSGHQILVERKHKREIPEWAWSDIKIRELLLQSFPKFRTDKRQAARAGRWARVIQLYFRMGKTHGQIAEEMSIDYNTVKMLIRAIKWSAKGKRTDGSGDFRRS
jgi:DNA-binding NarL/FixJ family response regulator